MDQDVRASDADREAVVERLQQAMVRGRITVAEFDERVAAAHAARTREELRVLTQDLPGSLW